MPASGGLLTGLAITPLGLAAASGLVLLMAALTFRLRASDKPVFPLLGDLMFLLLAAAVLLASG